MLSKPVTPSTAPATLSTNQKIIYGVIRAAGRTSRAGIVRHLNLTFPSISRIVTELIEKGMVVEGERRTGGMGKPPIDLSINPNHANSTGVHLEGEHATASFMSALGERIEDHTFFREPLAEQLTSLLFRDGVTPDRLIGIGLTAADERFSETDAQ
jgi:hypothetical protein